MGSSTPTVRGYMTVAEAAGQLGVKPWDVMRLIQVGEIQSVVLVEVASLEALKERA